MYETKTLGLTEARSAIDAILAAAATTEDPPIVVVVTDREGESIAFVRMDGAQYVSRSMAARKAYTSARTGVDSGTYGASMRQAGIDLKDLDPTFTGFAGGVCLHIDGAVVGAIGVSGRRAEQDEELARIGAGALVI